MLKHILPTFLLLGMLSCNARAVEQLPSSVAKSLADANIPLSNVGIWVQEVDATSPSITHNENLSMNPASVMKLVTSFAALEQFGPSNTWTTRIAKRGMVQQGRLYGDLFIVGGGDPSLDAERIWKLLREVRALGIQTVAGDIVLDSSMLRLPPHDPDSFDKRGLRPYNSGPYGLLMNFNTLILGLLPTAAGMPVTVLPYPPLNGISIENRVTASTDQCGVWYRNLDAALEIRQGTPTLVLQGTLPASCGRRNWSAAPLAPDRFTAALVGGLWAELEGKVTGKIRSGEVSSDADTLLIDVSPPLADILRDMNKWSSNVMARQLIADLASDDPTAADMVVSGGNAAKARLRDAGINTDGLVIENGSGLSRIERIRIDSLAQILITAWRRPYMPEFMASMPVAGLDGTARRRLRDSPASGQAHIKTGTINQVRAIAGYVLDRLGNRHVVVMIVNDANAAASRAAQDALLEWVWAARG